jgi:hypothetical protein
MMNNSYLLACIIQGESGGVWIVLGVTKRIPCRAMIAAGWLLVL